MTKYTYSFGVHPDESSVHDKAMYTLFQMMPRFEFEGTEEEFAMFRAGLQCYDITLREITRIPYYEPESVR